MGQIVEDGVYTTNIVVYAIQTFMTGLLCLLVTCIIVLHLYLKELLTVSGILIILFCIINDVYNVISFVYNRYQFTQTVNDNV